MKRPEGDKGDDLKKGSGWSKLAIMSVSSLEAGEGVLTATAGRARYLVASFFACRHPRNLKGGREVFDNAFPANFAIIQTCRRGEEDGEDGEDEEGGSLGSGRPSYKQAAEGKGLD